MYIDVRCQRVCGVGPKTPDSRAEPSRARRRGAKAGKGGSPEDDEACRGGPALAATTTIGQSAEAIVAELSDEGAQAGRQDAGVSFGARQEAEPCQLTSETPTEVREHGELWHRWQRFRRRCHHTSAGRRRRKAARGGCRRRARQSVAVVGSKGSGKRPTSVASQ